MAWFLPITLLIVSAYIAGVVAERKGRSVRTWQWMGALFGPFALIPVSLLPSSKQITHHA